jgi:spore germination cell wall hydrolase CwlJ-like protein
MAAVIWVIMNRVAASEVFASGPCEVIAQDGQFEPMTLGRYDDIADTIKAGGMPPFLNARGAERILQRTARLVVWQMMDGYFADDPTVGAQYFLAPAAMRALGRSLPDWTNTFTKTAAIGDHNFYRRDGL